MKNDVRYYVHVKRGLKLAVYDILFIFSELKFCGMLKTNLPLGLP